MAQIFFLLLVIMVFVDVPRVSGQDSELENDAIFEGKLNCRERNRLITDDKDDLYNVVEVALNEICSNEEDDGHAKNWFKMDDLNDSKFVELVLDVDSDMDLNRVFMNSDHTLTIRNITQEDRGEYLCKGLEADELENDYLFYLDVVIPTDIQPEKGNMSDWRKYHDEQLSPINKYLNGSNEKAILYLANTLKVQLQLETSWGRAGPCEICGRPKGDGRRFTEGHCRVKITHLEAASGENSSPLRKLVERATHLSCRSLILNELVPELINRTAYIPDFLLTEVCDGICNPDAEGVYKGWRSTKKGFKYKKTFVLAENAHLTLICPDSTLENHVQWKVNNKVIKAGESKVPPASKMESRVFVDTFNTLYLYGVTKDEEGNYTCYVDKIRMQQVRVFVVSKSRLLTQAFFRHMIYLAFVLSLTLSCYGAGLIVTYFRRHKFKTYREVRHEMKEKHLLMEDNLSDVTLSATYVQQDVRTSIQTPRGPNPDDYKEGEAKVEVGDGGTSMPISTEHLQNSQPDNARNNQQSETKVESDRVRDKSGSQRPTDELMTSKSSWTDENPVRLVGAPIREFDTLENPVELSSDSDIDEYNQDRKSLLRRPSIKKYAAIMKRKLNKRSQVN